MRFEIEVKTISAKSAAQKEKEESYLVIFCMGTEELEEGLEKLLRNQGQKVESSAWYAIFITAKSGGEIMKQLNGWHGEKGRAYIVAENLLLKTRGNETPVSVEILPVKA